MSVSLQYSNMNNAEAFLNLRHAPIDFALMGGNVLVSGIAGKKIYVYRIFFVVGSDTNLTFQDGTSTNLTGALPMVANGAIALDISNIPWFQTSDGKDFVLNSSANSQVSGAIYYQQT